MFCHPAGVLLYGLIPAEYIPSINFRLDVVEAGVVAVGDDGLRHLLKFLQVIYHEAAEEGGAVIESRFVYDDLGAFGFDALHDALDGGLAEVVTIGFHSEAIHADDWNGYR